MNLFLTITLFFISSIGAESRIDEAEGIDEVITKTDEQCLNEVMTNWFKMFNEAQSMGYDMAEADDVAIDYALTNYKKECL